MTVTPSKLCSDPQSAGWDFWVSLAPDTSDTLYNGLVVSAAGACPGYQILLELPAPVARKKLSTADTTQILIIPVLHVQGVGALMNFVQKLEASHHAVKLCQRPLLVFGKQKRLSGYRERSVIIEEKHLCAIISQELAFIGVSRT